VALLKPLTAEAPGARRSPSLVVLAQGLAVAIFFGLATLRFIVAPLDRYDEGVTLTKAALAAAGHVPYRDFWTTYGPLDTYLIAAAFKVLSVNVTVERGMAAGLLAVIGITAFRLIGYLGLRGALRLLLTGLITVVPLSVPAFNSAILANAIGLLALLAFFVSLDRERRRWPVLVGVLLGLSSFARPEFAAAVGAGLFVGYAIPVLRRQARPSAQLLPYLLGAAVAATALWLPMIAVAGFKPVWFDLVTYATDLYPKGRSIPFGRGGEGAVVIVFSIAFGLIWLWALVRAYRQRRDPLELARLLALLTGAVLIFTWVRTRADGTHAMDAWPLSATLLALLLQRRRRRTRPAPRLMEAAVSIAGILLLSVGAGGLALRDLAQPQASAELSRAGISGQRAWIPAPQLAALIREIDRLTPAGRPIWVGLQRNDLVTFNDTMLYFLSGREPGTVYYETLPGLTNAEGTERTIACQLDRSGVTLAVLGPNGAGEPWNLSSVAGSRFLDQWLRSRTVGRSTLGAYELLRLRPGSGGAGRCPSSDAS
jgi:hypothetical protein